MKSVIFPGIAAGVLALAACSGTGGQPPSASTPASTPAGTPASTPAAAPASTPASAPASQPVVYDCLGRPQTRPADLTLACADAGILLTRIGWSAWSAAGATGTGKLGVNDCQPDCAAGHFGYSRVTVTLSQPRAHAGTEYFTRLAMSGPSVPAQMRTWKLGTRGPGS